MFKGKKEREWDREGHRHVKRDERNGKRRCFTTAKAGGHSKRAVKSNIYQ